MKHEDMQAIADGALNAAAQYIQDQLKVKDGDVAGLFFTGEVEEEIIQHFVNYIRTELRYRNPWPFRRSYPAMPDLPPAPY